MLSHSSIWVYPSSGFLAHADGRGLRGLRVVILGARVVGISPYKLDIVEENGGSGRDRGAGFFARSNLVCARFCQTSSNSQVRWSSDICSVSASSWAHSCACLAFCLSPTTTACLARDPWSSLARSSLISSVRSHHVTSCSRASCSCFRLP